MTLRRPAPDLLAVAGLIGLWLFFFWRLFTPIPGDQASLARGDFSGQFVAFGAYQYARFSAGEIPLWNPHNNGGLPFIADTQAAVFYPPRLLTIALANASGTGWTYHALELEMTAHVLAYTLLMYALIRRMTREQTGSVYGAFIAAVVAGYNGFTTGYPLLQLALLEAAIWLPLGVLGAYEATRAGPIRWRWLVVAGLALGLSWMAGHPQTSYFLTLLLVAFYAWRVRLLHLPWTRFVAGVALFGAVAFGMAAVQLLPGFEYLSRTARVGFDYEAKGNGFPPQDIAQFLVPGVVSLFSPLFVGIPALALAGIALWRRASGALFWALVAVVALLWSFGANGVLYPLLYNLLPGLRYFRGQERTAYLVTNSLAILAGLGAVQLARWDALRRYGATTRLRLWLNRLWWLSLFFAALVVTAWLGNRDAYGSVVGPVVLAAVVAGLVAVLTPAIAERPASPLRWLLPALIVVELFTANMDADEVYDPVPPAEQLSMTPLPRLEPVLSDTDGVFRVDGWRGVHDNFASLYGLYDLRGISPLFLSSPFAIIEPEKINPLAWELFAVRYVFSDWEELPVPSEIVGRDADAFGPVNLHRLNNPRPFAHLVFRAEIVPGDDAALARLRDPAFDARNVILLDREPAITLPDEPSANASAEVTSFAPEQIAIRVQTPTDAMLSLAHPDYPGWSASLDGAPAPILRAYGALAAIAIPAGDHTVELVYDPFSYRAGATVSLVTWAALGILFLSTVIMSRARRDTGEDQAHA